MKLLIYREDSKVLVKDDKLPEAPSDNYEEIKKFVLKNMGFHVILTGKRNQDYIVAKRVFGSVNSGLTWEDVKSEKYKSLIEEDIEIWHNRALQTINILFQLFNEAGIDLYLFGGWGVDFLTGKVTRPHVDIDLFAWFKDKEIIKKLLMDNDFSLKEKGTKFQNDDEGFDIYFLDPDNVVKNPHGFTESPELLTNAVYAKLAGITVKVISPKLFKDALKKKLKFNQEHNENSGGPTDKTAHDLQLVEEYLSN